MDEEQQSIRTFAIEYSKQSYSKCTRCLKPIPKKSLRAATVIRKNKKQKKSQAEHQWCHFNCWKVPEELTKRPIEIFRGYPDLKDKDKKRVEKLIKAGTGVTWKELQRQLLKKVEDQVAETKTETQESSGHTYFNDDDDEDKDLKKTKNEIEKKKKKKNTNTEDIDMTAKLTGIQSDINPNSSKSPIKNQKKSKKTNNDQNINNKKKSNNNNNNNKINKKNQPKVQKEHQQETFVKLSNFKDQLELEAITKEIQSTLNK